MKLLTVALLLAAVPAFAQDKPAPEPAKPVYRTLDKMLKDFSRAAESRALRAGEPKTRG